MKRLLLKFWVLLCAVFALVACRAEDDLSNGAETSDVQVIASIYPMYEIAKEIAGDGVTVSLMVGANEDAHHYEPSAKAVASVNDADVFIYSSDEMEFWAESLLNVVENDNLEVVELGEGINFSFDHDEEGHDHEHEDHEHEEHNHNHDDHHYHGEDPHFWLNPVVVEQQLDRIVAALVAVDPDGAEVYEANAAAFSEELLELDAAYRTAFADASETVFVVQHQAFGHLAEEYGLEQVAVGGLTTEVEPSPKELAEIVEFVKEQNVPVVYYQNGENSAIAETIAAETGTGVAVLYDLENVPVTVSEETVSYIEVMYQNLEQLQLSVH